MNKVQEIALNKIKRPLPRRTIHRKSLMESMRRSGSLIDVLEVDGQYYGFSGCHRYEDASVWVKKPS